jgi:hypothetical protein
MSSQASLMIDSFSDPTLAAQKTHGFSGRMGHGKKRERTMSLRQLAQMQARGRKTGVGNQLRCRQRLLVCAPSRGNHLHGQWNCGERSHQGESQSRGPALITAETAGKQQADSHSQSNPRSGEKSYFRPAQCSLNHFCLPRSSAMTGYTHLDARPQTCVVAEIPVEPVFRFLSPNRNTTSASRGSRAASTCHSA